VLLALIIGLGAGRLGAGATPAPDGLVRMTIDSVRVDPETQSPLVLLTTAKRDRALLVVIGHAEGMAIVQQLRKLPKPPRPMTHDLLQRVLTRLGGTLDRVAITRLTEGTFYGELVVRQGDKLLRIDCRPSDAMALALRADAPIYCAPKVLEEAGVDFEPPDGDPPKPPARPDKPKKFI
jgi:bifunctional DNase/RNase